MSLLKWIELYLLNLTDCLGAVGKRGNVTVILDLLKILKLALSGIQATAPCSAMKLHSLVDKDVDFGVFAAARRADFLLFPARTSTLMHLTKGGINLKQGRILGAGIDEL